ncbi:MAG: TonB-dependent receptor [Bradyrhizobiaceae bacterium]|nr:TonB-dependent receptor [Bradyrhizobiaceae bacterium]
MLPLLFAALLAPQSAQTDSTDVRSILAKSVVVSSVRASDQAPITQSTIDSVRIAREMVGQDAEYVLERTIPSIVAYSESGTNLSNYGSFRLRGMDQTRVNVTLNGAPLNDMIDQGVFFSNITDLLNGMHSVQVQRGVGTASNGTASFAGSVSIESAMPVSQTPTARLQLTTGSFGLLRGSVEASTGTIAEGVSATVKLSSFSTDGYRYHTSTSGYSGMFGLSMQRGSDLFRLTAVGGRTQNQLGYLPVPEPLTIIDPRTNINDSTDHDDFGQYLLQAEWSHAFNYRTAISTMIYAGGAGGDYFGGFRDSIGMLTQINYPLENRNYGILSTFTLDDVWKGANLAAGVHAYTFRRRNWETVSPENLTPYYADTTRKQEVSAFAKLAWDIGEPADYPHVRVQADVQTRYVSMDFIPDAALSATTIPQHDWLFVNPNVGVHLQLNEQHEAYASVGSTGREPTRFDLLGGTQITPANIHVLTQPNTVRPEHVLDAEVGYRLRTTVFGELQPNLTLDVNAFGMMFTDEIAPVGQYIDQYFVQLRTNVAKSRRYGLEAQLHLAITSRLSLSANLTYMKSNINSVYLAAIDSTVHNVQAVLTPEWVNSTNLQWDPLSWLGITLSSRTLSSSFLELTNASNLTLSGFTLVDLGLQLHVDAVRFTFKCNNLGNLQYSTNGGVDYSTGSAVPALFMQAGRNFWIMAELQF